MTYQHQIELKLILGAQPDSLSLIRFVGRKLEMRIADLVLAEEIVFLFVQFSYLILGLGKTITTDWDTP